MKNLLTSILTLAVASQAIAAILTANNLSQTEVQSKINAAFAGDTVVLPAGSATWASAVTAHGAITIQGQGIGQTIISGQGQRVLNVSVPASSRIRITGIEFRDAGFVNYYSGRIGISGYTSGHFVVDNIKLTGTFPQWAIIISDVKGLFRNCWFGDNQMYPQWDEWGGIGDFGDYLWTQPPDFGGTNFVFWEDCHWDDPDAVQRTCIDSYTGAKWVMRYCNITNMIARSHGTDSSARRRSTRAIEFYNNNIINQAHLRPGDNQGKNYSEVLEVRGGTGLFYNNYYSNYNAGAALKVFRATSTYGPYGDANGSNPWDGNTNPPNPYPCLDQPGRGAGDLIAGDKDNPVNADLGGVPAWPRQALEPWYSWGNIPVGNSGGPIGTYDVWSDLVVADRDFYDGVVPDGYTPLPYPHPWAEDTEPSSGSVRFFQPVYTTTEGVNVTVTVERVDGSAGQVMVDYATSDGTATAGVHYIQASGTLIFPAGDISEEFTVQIYGDGSENATRDFTVTLSNPNGGATIGTPSSTTVQILDDDDSTPPLVKPLPSWGHYRVIGSTFVTQGVASSEPCQHRVGWSFGGGDGTFTWSPWTSNYAFEGFPTVTGLTPDTLLYYRGEARDQAGNVGWSGNTLIRTAAAPTEDVWYVDADHVSALDDPANGATTNLPLATVGYAVTNKAAPGDTIIIKKAATPYSFEYDGVPGFISLQNISGNPTNYTTIKGYDGQDRPVMADGRFIVNNGSYIEISDIEIDGTPDTDTLILIKNGSHDIVVSNMWLHHSINQLVHVHESSYNVEIVGNDLTDAGDLADSNGEGVYVGGHTNTTDWTSNVVIRLNTFTNMEAEGVDLKHSTRNCLVESNIFDTCSVDTDFGYSTIEVHEDLSGIGTDPNHIIRNNTIIDHNPSHGYAIYLKTGAECYNNIVLWRDLMHDDAYAIRIENPQSDTYPRVVGHNTLDVAAAYAVQQVNSGDYHVQANIGPGTSENLAINANYFTDYAGHDYSLVAGAAPIDLPHDLPVVVPEDIAGTPRDDAPDYGAYEYVAPVVPPPAPATLKAKTLTIGE